MFELLPLEESCVRVDMVVSVSASERRGDMLEFGREERTVGPGPTPPVVTP